MTQNWLKYFQQIFGQFTEKPDTIFRAKKKPKNPIAPNDLSSFVGTYANDYVGQAAVTLEDGKFVMRVGPNGVTRLPLRHWDANTFSTSRSRCRRASTPGSDLRGRPGDRGDQPGLGTLTRL